MNEALLSFSIVSLVATTLLLGLVLAIVVFSYKKTLKKLLEGREEILAEAREKANKIIADAASFTEEEKESFKAELGKSSQELKKASLKLMEEDFKNFLGSLDKELVSKKEEMKNLLEDQYKKDYEQIQTELNDYKKLMMQKLASQAKEILRDVSLKVFGKALNFDNHEELIRRSLEEAKKKHVL